MALMCLVGDTIATGGQPPPPAHVTFVHIKFRPFAVDRTGLYHLPGTRYKVCPRHIFLILEASIEKRPSSFSLPPHPHIPPASSTPSRATFASKKVVWMDGTAKNPRRLNSNTNIQPYTSSVHSK